MTTAHLLFMLGGAAAGFYIGGTGGSMQGALIGAAAGAAAGWAVHYYAFPTL